MMRLSTPLIASLGFSVLSACGGSAPLSDADKANIDCLASKTVMDIADAVRTGLESGAAPESLSGVQDEKTGAAETQLAAVIPGSAAKRYFLVETSTRLTAMQNALANRAPDSPDQKLTDQTMALAQSCAFSGV